MNDRSPRITRTPHRANTLVAGAALIAAAALLNGALARRAKRRHPPRGKFIAIDGVRLHYIEHGSGRPIVFLHGNGAMAEDCAISGALDPIARDHRIIAFDRSGFGHSARPRQTRWSVEEQGALLQKALREIGAEKPILVGHSWGALVALSMALEHPDEIAALVLLSGYYFPAPGAEAALGFWPRVPLLGDLLCHTIAPLLGWLLIGPLLRQIFAPDAATPAFMARFPLSLALRPSQIGASAADTMLMIPGAAALRHRLGELAMPVIIMAGSDDAIVTTSRHSVRLHTAIAHSELRILAGTGHMIHHIAPDAVADAIRAAVAAVDRGESGPKAATSSEGRG